MSHHGHHAHSNKDSGTRAKANGPNADAGANEGEGSRSAARHYNDATRDYIKAGRVEDAAKKAEAAVEGPEGKDLREAELAARATEPEMGDVTKQHGKKPQSDKQ